MFKQLNNKQLVDTINYRYSNGLNDDDYVAELCRRRKKQNKQIAIVNGELFIMVNVKENKWVN